MFLDLSLDNRIMLDKPLDCAIQELDMLFNTTNTELIGDVDYGTSFEQFLWEIVPSIEELKTYIYEKIATTYFASKYDIDINIRTEPGTLREVYYVELQININAIDEETKMKSRRVYMLA